MGTSRGQRARVHKLETDRGVQAGAQDLISSEHDAQLTADQRASSLNIARGGTRGTGKGRARLDLRDAFYQQRGDRA